MSLLKKSSIIFFILLLFFSLPVFSRDYEISNYDINLDLKKNGDYLISEKITFDFFEGTFSWVTRDIKGRGFDKLEFISIEGINTNIDDYELKQGNDLNLKWYFPKTAGKTTFILKYRTSGGLISNNEENIINWFAVGKGWQVDIYNLTVDINLPQKMNNIEASPSEDIIKKSENNIIFKKNYLSPGEAYQLKLNFPRIINTDKEVSESIESSSSTGLALFIGLLAGLIVALFDILKRKKDRPLKSKIKLDELSLAQIAVIYNQGNQNNSGIAAQIFALAREGKIKLISRVQKGFLKSQNSKIRVEILSETDLNNEDKIIVERLKKHKYLKKFAKDYKVFREVNQKVKDNLKKKDLFSKTSLKKRKNIFISSLILIPIGVAAIIYGGIKSSALIIWAGPFFFIIAIGHLIKGALTPILSGKGLFLKNEFKNILDDKKNELEKMIKADEADKALNYFFQKIEYIVIHKKFNATSIKKYKKVFKKAEKIDPPDWIELDLSDLDKNIDALNITEIVDYMMVSLLVINANTGAYTTSSTGAGSGGAAGGGGGAAG